MDSEVSKSQKKRKRDEMSAEPSTDKLEKKDKKKDKKDKSQKKEKSKDKKKDKQSQEEKPLEDSPPKKGKMSETVTANPSTSPSGLVPGRKAPASSANRLTPAEFREQKHIAIDRNDPLFDPILDFSELDFDPSLLTAIQGFQNPTPIQSQCWPIILAKKDIVGIAETGSGKTLAFSLPILYHIHGKTEKKNPSVLILSPTRELATQTAEVCTAAGATSGIRTLCVYGGVEKGPQIKALRSGVDIIVATPGRLMDLLNDKCTTLGSIKFFVLDEADRMLDMGFEKDIRTIADQIPKERQTLMFSATWPEIVRKIASMYLVDPIKVTIGSLDLSANRKVTQIVEVIDGAKRDGRLRDLLAKYHNGKNRVIIFVLYKKEATRVEEMLRNRGFNVQGIHADKNQMQRTQALEAFKNGKCPLLVATDVAARGLDVPDVEFVINYSFPLTIEDYVHRIGRTGRAGKTGIAHTFFTTFDKGHSGELIQVLKEAQQEVPADLMKFGTAVKPKEPKTGTIDLNKKSEGHLVFDSDSE